MRTKQFSFFISYFLLFFLLNFKIFAQNNTIELGVSYDDSFVSQFASEDEARDFIYSMEGAVNEIYFNALKNTNFRTSISITSLRKLNIFSNNPLKMRDISSRFWNNTVDLCNKVDLAHHITLNLNGADGQSGGGFCNIGPSNTQNNGCSVSEADINQPNDAYYNMAHEIGHNLGMVHEVSGCGMPQSSFMCSPRVVIPNLQYSLSTSNKNNLKNTINNSCASTQNTNVVDPSCPNCDLNSIITNVTDSKVNVIFGCQPTNDVFDISTSFGNNCEADRQFKIRFSYNVNELEIIDIGTNFSGPFDLPNTPTYNKYYESSWSNILEGGGEINTLTVKVKPPGRYPDLVAASALLNYFVNPPTASKDPKTGFTRAPTSNIPVIINIEFPYQIDKRGKPVVSATEIPVPPGNSYNFCFGAIKKDIYIDGDFEINKNQKYCNTNFFFGPNTTVTVKSGFTLELENSKLTSCGAQWKGIVLEDNAYLKINGTIIDNAITGVFSDKNNAQIEVYGQSTFSNFHTAVKLINTRLKRFENTHLLSGSFGLSLTNARSAILTNITMEKLSARGVYSKNTSLILSGCHISGGKFGRGIELLGMGHNLSIINDSKISGWHIGALCNKGAFSVQNSHFEDNYIACYQLSTPGLTHDFSYSNFDKGAFGILSLNSDLSFQSFIEYCTFENLSRGISITGKPNIYNGWYIFSNFTDIGTHGVVLTNADGNTIAGCNISGMGLNNSAMIRVNGGTANNLFSNKVNSGIITSESAQTNSISINSGITSLFCNDVAGGTYGYNIWGNSPMYFWQNKCISSNTGLYLGLYPSDGTALIGIQDHRFNQWGNGTMAVSAKHLGLDPAFVKQSQFVVKTGLLPRYMPNPRVSVAPDWFKTEDAQKQEHDCWNYDPNNPNPAQRSPGLTQGQSGKTGIANNQLQSSHVFESQAEEEYNSTSVPQIQNSNFYELSEDLFTKYATKSIQFGTWNDEIYANTAVQLYKLYARTGSGMSNYPGSLAYIQSISATAGLLVRAEDLIAGTNRYSHLVTESKALRDMMRDGVDLDSTSTDFIQWSALDSTIVQKYTDAYTLHLHDIDSALALLQVVQDPIAPFVNQKKLLIIKADMTRYNEITQLQADELSFIANQCPLSGGNAVYEARAILEVQNGEVTYNDHQLCQSTSPRTKKELADAIIIVPNPSSDKIWVSGASMHSIAIYDMQGNLMTTKNAGGLTEQEIDMSALAPAVYMVKVTYGDDMATKTLKCIKIK